MMVPVEMCSVQDQSALERATTENVCSVGARVLTRKPKERNERLMVRTVLGNFWTAARVVYCQRLSDGRFGVGIQLQGMRLKWGGDSVTSAAD
jgi:hypothetical protein